MSGISKIIINGEEYAVVDPSKVALYLGTEHAGKYLVVGNDGFVSYADAPDPTPTPEPETRLLNLNRSTTHLTSSQQTTPAAWVADVNGVIDGYAGYTNTVYGLNCLQSKSTDAVTVQALAGSTGVGYPLAVDPAKSYTLKCSADGSSSRVRIVYYQSDGTKISDSDVIMHGVASLDYTFTPPTNCAYAVFNFYSATNTTTAYTGVELTEN